MATVGKEYELIWNGSNIHNVSSIDLDIEDLSTDWDSSIKETKSFTLHDVKCLQPYEILRANEYQAYLKRGSKVFFRNRKCILSVELDQHNLKEIKTGYKNGDLLIIEYETK